MAQSAKRKSEGDATASRKEKSSKQGTRKSYNGPERSGYALDGGTLGSRNRSKKHLKSPFHDAKRQVSQKSDSLLQLIAAAERENKTTSSNPFKYQTRPNTSITTRSSTSVRDGQDIRDSLRTALQSLKQVTESYESANNRPSQLIEPSWMRWEKDETELGTLNQMTRDLSLFLTDCFISPSNRNPLANQAIFGEEDDIAKLSWENMEKAIPKKGDQTWGNRAHEFFKALADILQQSSSVTSGSRT